MNPLKRNPVLFMILVTAFVATVFGFDVRKAQKAAIRGGTIAPRALRTADDRPAFRKRGPGFAPGQVLVKFKPELGEPLLDETARAYGLEKIEQIPGLEIYKYQIPAGFTVEETVSALKQNPDIEYAEPNYVAHIVTTPNDTYFSYQYALLNTGQRIGSTGPAGTSGDDIKATSAWEETKGSAEVTIAIVDTGVDMLHPDLKNKIKSTGRDFVNNDNDATDDHGHGTIVAGIAAADTNNGLGIAGVAWNCKILPVKVLAANGFGFDYDVVAGIRWAVDNGASVINLSLGVLEPADVLRDTVKYAHEKGVVVCAAAGNEDTFVYYPAAYDAYVLAVAATDYNDVRPYWSNPGPQVDVAAPGVWIAGPVPTWYWAAHGGSSDDVPYAFADGTSMSSPQVAGLAALIRGLKPSLSADNIMDVIRYSADDVNSSQYKGRDDYIGYGRINMAKALVPIKVTAR
jgi:thermitase